MLSWVVVVTVLLGAPALKEPPNKVDDLRGAWRLEGGTRGGKDLAATGVPIVHVFHPDGSLTYQSGPAGPQTRYGSYKANPKGRPMTIDIVVDLAEFGGPGSLNGIYKVEGGVLTMCWHPMARPTDFTPPKDPSVTLGVFKRVPLKD